MKHWDSVSARAITAIGLVAAVSLATAQPANPSARQFPPGSVSQLDAVPSGRLRGELDPLPAPARERARQWLNSFHFTEQDLASLRADAKGGIYYVCEPAAEPGPAASGSPPMGQAPVPVNPFPAHLIFHSRPGAANVLYLNFTGETVSNTEWNNTVGRTSIPAVAFSTDSDFATFSDAEQSAIKKIWQRMAEDYAPFNMDVTTERPGSFNNRTAVALITRNTDANGDANPASTAGGVAYVNVFNTTQYSTYRPAWVYYNNLANEESYIAEAASHEIGHNLGLSHDGKTGSDYYGGHGSGEISWGPLMGTGYNRNVSQWSKGEYDRANNTQDDLATIAGKISYRTDDHGNTAGTATALAVVGVTNIVSTTPENDPANTNTVNKGVLDRNTDLDVFSIVTGSGPVRLAVNPWITPSGLTRGGNLDVRLELYNESGTLLMTNNPASQTSALIQTNLGEGRYYLYVRNSGAGDPFNSTPTGYTPYASIGQYFINGYVTEASTFIAPPVAELQVTDLAQSGETAKPFTVTYSDNVAVDVSTIDSNDIRVTGPNGYNQLAQFISLSTSGDGTPRTATYAVSTSGGGNWSPAHNGTYTIFMQTNQVVDTEGAYVAAGQLGQFQVAVPVGIYSANLDLDPGWTFQPDWEYGTPTYSGGNGPTSGFTGTKIVGYNLSGNYPNNLSVRYATTPPINTSGSTLLTLRFRRWLGLRNIDSATIQASTNGVNWVDVWLSAGAGVSDNGWQLVQHSLPGSVTGSSSLRLRWGLSSGGQGGRPTRIGWNIDDVELLGDGTLDTDPPLTSLSVADITLGGSPSHSCSVAYTDATAVRLSSLDFTDLLVTGPNGYSNLVEFVGADLPMDGTPMTGSYSIPAPGGTWDPADNGTYTVTLEAGAVEDTLNNATPQATLGTFNVAISTAAPGLLGVSPAGNLNSSGIVGGPFSPPSIVYTLTNSGGSTLNWTISKTANWVSLSASSGSLAAGDSTNVTVSLNSTADSLTAGGYNDTVSFVNTTTGNGNTGRGVNLTINSTVTFQLTVNVNNAIWGGVSPTNGTYAGGSFVEVVASPATYYQFGSWTGDVSTLTNPVTVVLNSNVTLQANFAEVLTTHYPTPHWWLAQYGYTNDLENAVTQTGANNFALWQSYLAGLNPNDPESQLGLSFEILPSGSEQVLRWTTVSGRVYSVWSSANLPDGFEPLAGATNLAWTVQSVTNSTDRSLPGRYYRLEVRKP